MDFVHVRINLVLHMFSKAPIIFFFKLYFFPFYKMYFITTKMVIESWSPFFQPIEVPVASLEENNPEGDGDSWRLCNALSSNGLLQLLAFYDLKSVASSDPRTFSRRSQVFAISQPGSYLLFLYMSMHSLHVHFYFCRCILRCIHVSIYTHSAYS